MVRFFWLRLLGDILCVLLLLDQAVERDRSERADSRGENERVERADKHRGDSLSSAMATRIAAISTAQLIDASATRGSVVK